MNECERRLGQRVSQILIEAANLPGEQQALVDKGARRKGRHVEFGQAGQLMLFRKCCQRILRLLAECQQFALERVLTGGRSSATDNGLPNHGHLFENGAAQPLRVNRHVPPADQDLTFLDNKTFEMRRREIPRCLITRQEAHRDCIIACGWQSESLALRPIAQQFIGNLDENAGPIAKKGISTNR